MRSSKSTVGSGQGRGYTVPVAREESTSYRTQQYSGAECKNPTGLVLVFSPGGRFSLAVSHRS